MKAAVSPFPRVSATGQNKILLNSDPFPVGREPSGWLPSGGCRAFEKLSRECTIRQHPTVPLRFKDTSPEADPSDTDPLSLNVKVNFKAKVKFKVKVNLE